MSPVDGIPDRVLYWLGAAVLVAALPHFAHLPAWVAALLPATILMRVGLRRPPGRWLLIPLVATVFVGILVQFRAISGPDAGGAFFTAMVALKFLESRTARDLGLIVCLAWFQAVAIFLYSESIGMAVYVLGSLALTTTTLITLAAPDGPPLQQRLGVTGKLFLQAIPIMLVLFVLFPRISGPLWSIHDAPAARTGLSDSMAPGEVADLAMSPEVAFRVEFADTVPPGDRHYWRGPIFTDFDGRRWTEGDPPERPEPELVTTGEPVEYTITLEAHEQRWLFALDMPVDPLPADTRLSSGRQLLTRDRVRSTRRFELRSVTDYRLEPELPAERRDATLALPASGAEQARELAAEWRAETDTDAERVERALAWFRESDFEYTLSPQRLDDDPVDEFLFDTRAGFCEHFASSFAVLMRAAGIPARIVTGYLGSEPGGPGGYFIVRQSSAHAWVEVWLEDAGWVRVDPTTTVAPDRIRLGLGGMESTRDLLPDISRRDDSVRRRIALMWDAVNHNWNRFVLGYGPDLQSRLLERLGLGDFGRYALAALSMGVFALLLVAIGLLTLRARPPRDPVLRHWRRVERRLAALGLERGPAEGVSAYAERVARARPDIAGAIRDLAGLYDRLRYQPDPDTGTLRALERASRAFRPAGPAQARPTAAEEQADDASSSGNR